MVLALCVCNGNNSKRDPEVLEVPLHMDLRENVLLAEGPDD